MVASQIALERRQFITLKLDVKDVLDREQCSISLIESIMLIDHVQDLIAFNPSAFFGNRVFLYRELPAHYSPSKPLLVLPRAWYQGTQTLLGLRGAGQTSFRPLGAK